MITASSKITFCHVQELDRLSYLEFAGGGGGALGGAPFSGAPGVVGSKYAGETGDLRVAALPQGRLYV